MRDLYDRITADGEPAIEALVGRQETVELEFKVKEDATNGDPSLRDRKRFGEILSAFSNSSGDLAIWGMQAAKDADGIDRATKPEPVADIARFTNWAIGACSEVLMPRHEGIHIEQVASQREPGKGYLLVYVERSDRRPHRSEVRGDKQYYKRTGDSCIAMEHYDIEDSFRRLTVPTLDLKIDLSVGEPSVHAFQGLIARKILVALSLFNPSSVTARYPYLMLEDSSSFSVEANFGLPNRHLGTKLWYEGNADHVIHPGLERPFVTIAFAVEVPAIGLPVIGIPPSVAAINLSCLYGSEHARSLSSSMTLTPAEIVKLLRGA